MTNDEIAKPPRAAWLVSALCCGISLSLCAAGGVLFSASLLLALVGAGQTVSAAGLLGAAIAGSAGALSLLWSIARIRRG